MTICQVGFRVSYERGIHIDYSTCWFHFQTIPELVGEAIKSTDKQMQEYTLSNYKITPVECRVSAFST